MISAEMQSNWLFRSAGNKRRLVGCRVDTVRISVQEKGGEQFAGKPIDDDAISYWQKLVFPEEP